tara:strand:- start:965 stop:1426 length:462 start_codon:yes stop_codon:yes gene_type:complete
MYLSLNTRLNNIAHYNALNARRECFCSTAEAEGSLITGSYPFSMGTGSVSSVPFGLPVFFQHRVLGYALASVSADAIPLVEFFIEHLAEGATESTIIDRFVMDNMKSVSRKITSLIFPPGQICIRVGDIDGLDDEFAKYRIALYLQAEESLLA